jgi:hypothetical protein
MCWDLHLLPCIWMRDAGCSGKSSRTHDIPLVPGQDTPTLVGYAHMLAHLNGMGSKLCASRLGFMRIRVRVSGIALDLCDGSYYMKAVFSHILLQVVHCSVKGFIPNHNHTS